MSNEIAKREESMLATESNVPMGFEDEDEGDMIIPRIKVINMLSPEFKEKVAPRRKAERQSDTDAAPSALRIGSFREKLPYLHGIPGLSGYDRLNTAFAGLAGEISDEDQTPGRVNR